MNHNKLSSSTEISPSSPEAEGERAAQQYTNLNNAMEVLGYSAPKNQQEIAEAISQETVDNKRQVRRGTVPELRATKHEYGQVLTEHAKANLHEAGIRTTGEYGAVIVNNEGKITTETQRASEDLSLARQYGEMITDPANKDKNFSKVLHESALNKGTFESSTEEGASRQESLKYTLAGLGVTGEAIGGIAPDAWQQNTSEHGVTTRTYDLPTDIPGVFVKITQQKQGSAESLAYSLSAGNQEAESAMFG